MNHRRLRVSSFTKLHCPRPGIELRPSVPLFLSSACSTHLQRVLTSIEHGVEEFHCSRVVRHHADGVALVGGAKAGEGASEGVKNVDLVNSL